MTKPFGGSMFNRSSKKQQTVDDNTSVIMEGNGMVTHEDQSASQLTDNGVSGELERVRDLLFGKQTKATDEKLIQLENRIEDVNRTLTNLMEERFRELNKSFSSQIEALRKELTEYTDQQATKSQSNLQSTKQLLTERIDAQEKDQTEKVRSAQRSLSERIDSLANETSTQLKNAQQELSSRIETVNTEQSERTNNLQAESSQRDDALRNELIALGKTLGNQKVSRREMTQLLAELAQRLQNEER